MARRKRPRTRPTIRRMLETTPARVASPMALGATDEPIPDEDLGWEPLELPRAIRSRRTFRIPVVVIALVLAAGIGYGGYAALRLPMAHAESERQALSQVLETTAASISALRSAADQITAPDGTADPSAALTRFETLADDLHAAAEQGMLLVVPGLPTEDLDILDPIRSRVVSIADRLTAVSDVLRDVTDYRRALADMFLLPSLPGPDEGPSVEVFSDRLAQMTAATVEAAATLPDSALFDGHRTEIAALLRWLPEWQAGYLDALRDGDLDLAESLRNEAAGRIAAIHTALEAPLAGAADWVHGEIDRLERDVAAALVLAG